MHKLKFYNNYSFYSFWKYSSFTFVFEMGKEKLIRLNKYLAHAGLGTRRECDAFIAKGEVYVNDLLITTAGTKISINDKVTYLGEIVQAEKKVYILLNKPHNISSFKTDNKKMKSIYYLTHSFSEKLNFGYTPDIKPIDILDINERGLILMTNDKILFKKLHKNPKAEKIYHIILDKVLLEKDYQKIMQGFKLESGSFKVKELNLLEEERNIGIKIQIANNNILVELFKKLNYSIEFMDRTVLAGLNKRDLPRGKWRFLTDKEILRLRLIK